MKTTTHAIIRSNPITNTFATPCGGTVPVVGMAPVLPVLATCKKCRMFVKRAGSTTAWLAASDLKLHSQAHAMAWANIAVEAAKLELTGAEERLETAKHNLVDCQKLQKFIDTL